jgi:hypothetical protein
MKELTNPFNANFERKMLVYPDAHKHCHGRCKCQRQEIWVKFPNISETKDNDFCQKHNLKFVNEQHKLPSGKSCWVGCPMCRVKIQEAAHRRDMELYMQDNGMRINPVTKEWYKPIHIEKPPANDYYSDVRTLGYKD